MAIRTAGYAQSLAVASGPIVPIVAAIVTFLGVVMSGNDLLASDVRKEEGYGRQTLLAGILRDYGLFRDGLRHSHDSIRCAVSGRSDGRSEENTGRNRETRA